MQKIRVYQLTIGVLAAFILIFNVVVPYLNSRKSDSFAKNLITYNASLQTTNPAQRETLLNEFLSEELGKSFAMKASADKLEPCALNQLAFRNLMNWWESNPDNDLPQDIFSDLMDAMIRYCGSAYGAPTAFPIVN